MIFGLIALMALAVAGATLMRRSTAPAAAPGPVAGPVSVPTAPAPSTAPPSPDLPAVRKAMSECNAAAA